MLEFSNFIDLYLVNRVASWQRDSWGSGVKPDEYWLALTNGMVGYITHDGSSATIKATPPKQGERR